MRPDQLERGLRERLDALGPAPRAELLHVLMLPDFERADRIGEFWGYPESRAFVDRRRRSCSRPRATTRRHTFATWIAEHSLATSRMAYEWPERAEGKEAAMSRIIQRGLLAALLVGVLAIPGVASAAANPSGTGQPSQSCLSESAPAEPGGSASAPGSAFNENGGIAGGVYAGSPGTPSAANGSSTAVSQYDVACYQVSQHQ